MAELKDLTIMHLALECTAHDAITRWGPPDSIDDIGYGCHGITFRYSGGHLVRFFNEDRSRARRGVSEIAGTTIERQGQLLLKKGDSYDDVVAVLGSPAEESHVDDEHDLTYFDAAFLLFVLFDCDNLVSSFEMAAHSDEPDLAELFRT